MLGSVPDNGMPVLPGESAFFASCRGASPARFVSGGSYAASDEPLRGRSVLLNAKLKSAVV